MKKLRIKQYHLEKWNIHNYKTWSIIIENLTYKMKLKSKMNKSDVEYQRPNLNSSPWWRPEHVCKE